MYDFNGNNKGPRSASLARYPYLSSPAVIITDSKKRAILNLPNEICHLFTV